jgi:hypothetical protein
MNTKLLMSLSAVFMAALGILASFFPQEILSYLDAQYERPLVLIIQVIGALYLGFAIVNWMLRSSRIGGIYNRPIVLGNLLHFTIAALALLKELMISQNAVVLAGAVIYSVIAVCFGFVMFNRTSQVKAK